jgi:hypothetical protein
MTNEVFWVVNRVVRKESDISEVHIVIFGVGENPRLLAAYYRRFLPLGLFRNAGPESCTHGLLCTFHHYPPDNM